MIGLIGGTGFYDSEFLADPEKVLVETDYGRVSLHIGRLGTVKAAFIARHGEGHKIPPHTVNYLGNISAFKEAGVKRVISINSVGSLKTTIAPGGVVVPHDFIDFTKGRESTFHKEEVVHVDMTEPYCPVVREVLIDHARMFLDTVHSKGVYVCTEGPRFETPSEIRMLGQLGGDVVGMVGYPEVVLAREAGLCYGAICTVANMGCGLTNRPMTIEDVKKVVEKNIAPIKEVITHSVKRLSREGSCRCAETAGDVIS